MSKNPIDPRINLIRSKRKTLSLIIGENAKITVRAPLRCSIEEINAFVQKHRKWIEEKSAVSSALYQAKQSARQNGVLLKGKTLQIERVPTSEFAVRISGDKIFIADDLGEHESAYLTKLFKLKAKPYLLNRTRALSIEYGFRPSIIRITSAATKWGSCNFAKKSINLNWRLVMAPEELADYVIIHELCHLRHPNHSKKFWDEVGKYIPDYSARRKKLREIGYLLGFE